MKERIILQSDMENLGLAGEEVEVAKGYARNYLYPKKLAVTASQSNRKRLAAIIATVTDRKKRVEDQARDYASKLEDLSLTIEAKVGEGKLFGSVTSIDVAKALEAAGYEVDRRKIELKTPIKELGVYHISVKVHPRVTAEVRVDVIPEGGVEAPVQEEAAPETEAIETEPVETEAVEAEAAEATEEKVEKTESEE